MPKIRISITIDKPDKNRASRKLAKVGSNLSRFFQERVRDLLAGKYDKISKSKKREGVK